VSMQYWIAQYIKDPIRKEPINIGVFVRNTEQMAAKFLGENERNKIIKKKLSWFTNPDVYRQWVDYWREQIAKNDPRKIEKPNGSHFRVVDWGEVIDTGDDPPQQVADYLFSRLVSYGGLTEALQDKSEVITKSKPLEREFSGILRKYDLLKDRPELHIKYPIRKDVEILGSNIVHRPSFVQENGILHIMELVDFTVSQKKRSLDHAGFSAYMFRDIKDSRSKVENYAIVRVSDEDKERDDVQYGLKVLENESDIIDWSDQKQQKAFVEERKKIAA